MPVEPTCPDGYKFNKDKCSCKKPIKRPKKLILVEREPSAVKDFVEDLDLKKKRCPKGTRRNKKTGKCESTEKKALQKTLKKPVKTPVKTPVKKPTVKKQPKKVGKRTLKQKRCPKGTRRNKKTGKCEDKEGNVIEIADTTPVLNRVLGDQIQKNIEKGKKTDLAELVKEVTPKLKKNKTFSPAINKKLHTLKSERALTNVFGCTWTVEMRDKVGFHTTNWPRVPDLSDPGQCVSYQAPQAQRLLLKNLAVKHVTTTNIMAPEQFQSNCWFNTMFMAFFISDKGRKFFRYFRTLMIKGETSTGKKLSDKLWQSLALLNLSIEASLGSNTDKESDAARFAELLDTNNIIRGIHDSIPREDEKTVGAIKKTGKSNNPYSYYRDLVKYLGDDSLNMRKYVASIVVPSSLTSISAARFAAEAGPLIFDDIKERISKDLPDVVILEYLQDNYTTVKRESFSVKTPKGRKLNMLLIQLLYVIIKSITSVLF